MSKNNEFYNRPAFNLIKVKFSEHDQMRYTYASLVSQDVEVGDWVTVPVGKTENVFGVPTGYRDIQTVEVTGVTKDMRHLPKDFDVKHIISNLKDGAPYRKVHHAKLKFIKS